MKQYLKMAGAFDLPVKTRHVHDENGYGFKLMLLHSVEAEYAAHAINSHDELVKRLAVMTELVGKMNCYCRMSGLSAKSNSENPVESWMYGADEALDAIRSAS